MSFQHSITHDASGESSGTFVRTVMVQTPMGAAMMVPVHRPQPTRLNDAHRRELERQLDACVCELRTHVEQTRRSDVSGGMPVLSDGVAAAPATR